MTGQRNIRGIRTPGARAFSGAWVFSVALAASVQAGEVTIIHINVGQGDATLILGPEDAAGARASVLVDAGNIPMSGRDGGRIIGAVLGKNGVEKLDHFIATHYDADHIGGVIAGSESMYGHSFVLGRNNVPGDAGDDDGDGLADWLDDDPDDMMKPDPEELGTGDDLPVTHFVDRGDAGAPTTKTCRKYRALAEAKGTRTSLATQQDVNGFEIDLGGGATMICLAGNGFVRDRASHVANVNTENERSLCFLLRFGGFDYLIGGDTIGRTHGSENAKVEAAIGEYLSDNGINVDVLHVNHHGGNNASATEFLEAVSPEIAVISLGNGNAHHHPNAEALQRIVDANVYRIYQTEWGTTEGATPETVRRHQAIFQGDVIITSDGESYEVSTQRRYRVDD